ncbi:nucleoside-triphosphatase [Chloroflexota bacterium]
MVIIVVGNIGIGKTTVCEKALKVLQHAGYTCGGILTYRVGNESRTVLDVRTGASKVFASTEDIYDGPRFGKYFFNPEGIEFGLKAIEEGVTSDVLFVDEIGYLELSDRGFAKALELVKAQKVKNSVLVIREQLLNAFLAKISENPRILKVTTDNRNKLAEKIYLSLAGTPQ